MIQWKFYLDDVLVDEPIGWNDINLTIKRDEQWQGVFFEASTSTLGFYGDAADTITEAKNNYGFNAEIELRVEAVCGQTVDILTGQLDFGTYQRSCGNECIVYISVEKSGCTMKVRNRYDQKVDLTKITAFDNFTNLVDYPGLNFTMEVAAQELDARVEGLVDLGGGEETDFEVVNTGPNNIAWVRPLYGRLIFNSINRGQLNDPENVQTDDDELALPITPQLLFEDTITCFNGSFTYDVRLKGRYSGTVFAVPITDARIILGTWDGNGSIFTDIDIIDEVALSTPPAPLEVVEFDETFTGTTPLSDGVGLYHILEVNFGATLSGYTLRYQFDEESSFLVYATKSCPPTDATVSLINETGSRIAEAITDGCLRMKSDYYGRTDSQPYQSDEDGCGALRVL